MGTEQKECLAEVKSGPGCSEVGDCKPGQICPPANSVDQQQMLRCGGHSEYAKHHCSNVEQREKTE